MRLLFLVLLVAVIVHSASIGEKIKGFFNGSFVENLKNVAKVGIKKALEGTGLLKIRDKIKSLGSKIREKLTLSKERKAALAEKLKNLKIIKDTKGTSGDSIVDVNQKSEIGSVLYQSDIALNAEQAQEIEDQVTEKRAKRAAFVDHHFPDTLWKDGQVFYDFYPTLGERAKQVFILAAKAWESKTCLNFTKVDHEKHGRIDVSQLNGCWSQLGFQFGKKLQDLSVGEGCHTVGIAAHEIGHALGLYHTMNRPDRDNFITVNSDKIQPDYLDQFIVYTKDIETYGITYDYGSIMHYGATSVSSDKVSVTMLPIDSNYRSTLGSHIISFYDYMMINKLYSCDKVCEKAGKITCENGGFQNPKNCNECVCPSGYGGAFCSDKPEGCGSKHIAKDEWQTLKSVLGRGKDTDEFSTCNYWIESAPGTQIEVRIKDISSGLSTDGCTLGGVEIKAHQDQKLTGYRFCSFVDSGIILKSHSNRVPIITYNKISTSEFELEYRIAQSMPSAPKISDTISIPADQCFDQPSCTTWKLLGLCKTKSSEEKRKCPKTCGLC